MSAKKEIHSHFISFLNSSVQLPSIPVEERAALSWVGWLKDNFSPLWEVSICEEREEMETVVFVTHWYRLTERSGA